MDRLNPLYSGGAQQNLSFDFYDDGDVLYVPRLGDGFSVVDTSDLDSGDYERFEGGSYESRVDDFVKSRYSEFILPGRGGVKGWCSWDTYFHYLDYEKLSKELSFAVDVNRNYDDEFKYLLVDHGYGEVGQLLVDSGMD